MAIELATGYVSIVPSAKGFGAKLQSEIGSDLDSVGEGAGDRVSKGFMSKFSSSTGVKIGAALAGAFATAKIGEGLSGAIQNASALGETVSKTGVIFGDSAGIVEDFAAGAAKGFGQSKKQALDAASTFAIFGKGAGLSGDQLAGFSTNLVGLSSDFASFFDSSPEEAIEAIGAALRGESEPIRKYGVLLDDATLRARALKLGLISSTKDALTPQQKVLAAQAEIMAQTGDVQGDFARTSETAANKQRQLAAQTENASAQFGAALLPAYTAFVTLLSERVLPALTQVITFLTEHKGVAIAVAAVIGGILVVALLAWAAAAIAAAVATLAAIAPILLIAAAVVGFIAVMIVLPTIVGENIGTIVDFFINAGRAIGDFFLRLPGIILGALAGAAGWLVDTGVAIIRGLIDGIASLVPAVVQFFTGLPGNILDWVQDLAESLLHGHGQQVIQGILNGVESLIGAVAGFFTSIPGWIVGWVAALAVSLLFGNGREVIQGILNGASSAIGAVANFFASIPGWILGWIGNLGSLLFGVGASAIQGFINGMNSWIGSIAGAVSNIPSIVRGAIGDLGGALFGAGQSVVRGLIDGINAMLGPLRAALGAVTSLIPSWKGPPSKDAKLLYGSGQLILGGLIAGIDSALPRLRGQLGGVTSMFGASQPFSVTSSLSAAPVGASAGMPVGDINVYAQTNASPQEIARELSWTLMTRGR